MGGPVVIGYPPVARVQARVDPADPADAVLVAN